MNITLHIDYREGKLIDLLNKTEPRTPFKTENLDLGDIQLKNKEEIVLVIERKTISDLKCSIVDGRFREQKSRLLSNINPQKIIYLIEGKDLDSQDKKVFGIPLSSLLGSLINAQFRDGIKVYKTNSLNESLNFLLCLYEKVNKSPCDLIKLFPKTQETEEEVSQTQYIVPRKRDNITTSSFVLNSLLLIPQVSLNIATEITKFHPTSLSLVTLFQIDLNPKLALAEIKYPITNGKFRRVGEKISTRIYEMFCGETNISLK